MPRRTTQGEYNEELRRQIVEAFGEIHVLTSEEVANDFLIWNRARRLFPGLEETLEPAQFVLLKDYNVVARETIGHEYHPRNVLRELSDEESAACVANEHVRCFMLNRVQVHEMDIKKMIPDPMKGHIWHRPITPGSTGWNWGNRLRGQRRTMQTGII